MLGVARMNIYGGLNAHPCARLGDPRGVGITLVRQVVVGEQEHAP